MVTEPQKTAFQQTEVGEIPSDWEVKTLGSYLLKSPDYGINAAAVPYNGNMPVYLRITDITEDGKYSKKNVVCVDNSLSDNYHLQAGDMVFARTGASVGKTYLYNPEDGKLVFAGFLIRITANKELLVPEYLKYFTQMQYYKNWIASNSMRTGQPGINGKEYKELLISLPPTLAEQTAIATALTDADALITRLETLIAKKKAMKQGAMQTLLKPKAGWEVKKFGEVVEKIIGGGTPSRSNLDYWGGDIPWITVKDFATFSPSRAQEYITKEGLKLSSSNLIPKGTLITSTRMALGKAVIYEVDVSINQDLKAIFPKSILNVTYLYYWFEKNSLFLAEMGSGSTVMGLSLIDMKNIKFDLPSLSEQTRIAQILSDMDAGIEKLEEQLAKQKRLKQGMMQVLLTGKIRLVTR